MPIIEYDRGEEEGEELFVADSALGAVISEDNKEVTDDEKVIVTVKDKSDDGDIFVTVLGTVDLFGLLWIFLAILSILVFLLFWCCCRRVTNKAKDAGAEEALKTSSALRPDLLVIPFLEDEADEYSESSRVHLAQGVDMKDPLRRQPQYVTVQGVRSEPMEDGVVCGSLTLGPSFGSSRDSSGIRAVSSNILKQQTFSKV